MSSMKAGTHIQANRQEVPTKKSRERSMVRRQQKSRKEKTSRKGAAALVADAQTSTGIEDQNR